MRYSQLHYHRLRRGGMVFAPSHRVTGPVLNVHEHPVSKRYTHTKKRENHKKKRKEREGSLCPSSLLYHLLLFCSSILSLLSAVVLYSNILLLLLRLRRLLAAGLLRHRRRYPNWPDDPVSRAPVFGRPPPAHHHPPHRSDVDVDSSLTDTISSSNLAFYRRTHHTCSLSPRVYCLDFFCTVPPICIENSKL